MYAAAGSLALRVTGGWAELWSRWTRAALSPVEAGWLVLVPGLILVVPSIGPQPDVLVLGLPVAAAVFLLGRRTVGRGTIALLFAVGVLLRAACSAVHESA